eukprot:c18202_g1_i1.p1 GENE.c18202_g1_i1~~c18202_g1_i1.p1  ORF type:complete len:104 (+),score=8.35 c18202_g1_i1:454-765(+)
MGAKAMSMRVQFVGVPVSRVRRVMVCREGRLSSIHAAAAQVPKRRVQPAPTFVTEWRTAVVLKICAVCVEAMIGRAWAATVCHTPPSATIRVACVEGMEIHVG